MKLFTCCIPLFCPLSVRGTVYTAVINRLNDNDTISWSWFSRFSFQNTSEKKKVQKDKITKKRSQDAKKTESKICHCLDQIELFVQDDFTSSSHVLAGLSSSFVGTGLKTNDGLACLDNIVGEFTNVGFWRFGSQPRSGPLWVFVGLFKVENTNKTKWWKTMIKTLYSS